MKINFSTMTDDERTAEFAKMSDADLTAYRTEARAEASTLFALTDPTLADADSAVALQASIKAVEREQADRAAEAKKTADAFAAAKAEFSETGAEPGTPAENQTGVDAESGDDEDGEDAETDEERVAREQAEAAANGDDNAEVEAAKGENPFPKKDAEEDEEKDKKVTTASARRAGTRLPASQSAARKVGSQTKRPAKAKGQAVVITAAANVPDVQAGSRLEGMDAVTAAVQSQAKSGPAFNLRAAEALQSEGVTERLDKRPVASFQVPFDSTMVASGPGATGKGVDHEYASTKAALDRHREVVMASMLGTEAPNADEPLTAAAAWCAPSETVYSWLADYVVDGLVTIPEVSAKRGGLFITQGPQLAQTTYAGDLVDEFGFGGTEAEMEAGYIKTCETIECPEFVDHRLDFDGFCWKIPILTETAFPELVTDAMRLGDVLYAHKMNRRFLTDIANGSTLVPTTGLGAVFTDTLEALTIIAVKERRWWNIGEKAVMEVKLPQHALDIFKMDMTRRTGLALDDIATEQKIAAHFANHNLSVQYVSGLQNIHQATVTGAWPVNLPALIYPVGTWVKAVEPVIRLSAVHDAASLSENEYTGVFFEQGVMTVKVGYRSHKVNIPVNTAGLTGAPILDGNPLTPNNATPVPVP